MMGAEHDPEADILKTRILDWVPLPTFRGPTSHSKMTGLEIFPHPTCEVKGSGDCECLHPISHMASEKWEVRLKQEFPFLKYLPLTAVQHSEEQKMRLSCPTAI